MNLSSELPTDADKVDGKLRNGATLAQEILKSDAKKHPKEDTALTNGKIEMDSTKLAFQQFFKSRTEAGNKNERMVGKNTQKDTFLGKPILPSETLLNKTVHNLIKIKKDIFCQTNDTSLLKSSGHSM